MTPSSPAGKRILVLGAGRSATCLIEYLAVRAPENGWQLTVGDASLELVQAKTAAYSHVQAVEFDAFEQRHREKYIAGADVVISMMPAASHAYVARTCIRLKKHLLTASYTSPEIRELDTEARKNNILILMEAGLDPGIDHLSAMQVIDRIRERGGFITLFKSYCGGLIAPESDTNPWGYKFTWNPRNVVLAGQGTVKYLANGQYKYIPYHRLFASTEKVPVGGHGTFEAYANRDSLVYQQLYKLDRVETLLRGTLRKEGYATAWQGLIQLGMTEDTYPLEGSASMTWRQYTESFLPEPNGQAKSLEERLAQGAGVAADSAELQKLLWLGLLDEEPMGLDNATPAQALQYLLEKKWALAPTDVDMIVMQHQFGYVVDGLEGKLTSSLVVKGEDSLRTAMAKTVGWTLAIACKLLLEGKITVRGVQIPVAKEIYQPVLAELAELGIRFEEEER